MAPFVGTVLDERSAEVVAELARRYLAGRRPLFEERMASAFIRDGHGDLLADDIFLLDDGPRVLDCIEFADRYRYGDVLADIAFLAMDLESLGAPRLAADLMRWYDEFSGHAHPWTLADHYIAYRAHVRAKVMCLRHAQGAEPGVGVMAENLLQLARRHLERSRAMLVLVGGLPGTGKSTLAAGLADARGWAYLSSDEVRKDIAGMGHTMPAVAEYETGLYTPDRVDAVYEELLRRARQCLGLGVPVVLDASWRRREWRQRAAEVAAATSSDLVELQCLAPTEVAVERMTGRRLSGPSTSDADPGIAARMAASFDSWDSALPIYTVGPAASSVRSALLAIASSLGDSREVAEGWTQGP